jgi:hypothetical protein
MLLSRHNELARVLADIDGLLVEAEDIAQDPPSEDRDRALDLLVAFQEYKRAVEGELRGR